MKKTWIFCYIFFPIAAFAGILYFYGGFCECSEDKVELWPEIEPFETGTLKVSDIHELYYELAGNPEGRPVMFLHGGPGGASSPYMRQFCDPDKFLMVLHDQRGAGKSKPFGETRENTTQHLVQDIERLRKHLKLGKVILWGGSWGATLALAYAETYPKNVSGLVLRGVFTATKEEIDHFYHGGVKLFFPEVYEAFQKSMPEPDSRPLAEHLFTLINDGSKADKEKYAMAWARYEIKISGLDVPDDKVEHILTLFDPYAFGILENYYMANSCFLEEGQLLRDAKKLVGIPAVIVNGRYDTICPPITAYRLHKQLPKSKLVIAESAGHWMGEKPIEQALLQAMREFE